MAEPNQYMTKGREYAAAARLARGIRGSIGTNSLPVHDDLTQCLEVVRKYNEQAVTAAKRRVADLGGYFPRHTHDHSNYLEGIDNFLDNAPANLTRDFTSPLKNGTSTRARFFNYYELAGYCWFFALALEKDSRTVYQIGRKIDGQRKATVHNRLSKAQNGVAKLARRIASSISGQGLPTPSDVAQCLGAVHKYKGLAQQATRSRVAELGFTFPRLYGDSDYHSGIIRFMRMTKIEQEPCFTTHIQHRRLTLTNFFDFEELARYCIIFAETLEKEAKPSKQ